MVQLTDYSQFEQNGDSLDLYWKLDNGVQYDRDGLLDILEDQNFPHENSTSRARLQELYTRCQRKFMSYELLDLPKLQLCIAQRGLSFPAKKDTLASLKAMLEHVDEKATFLRFLDLQPELRLQIYNHHFNSFAGTPANVISQPPITGVSRQVREESLPAFYGCFIFEVIMTSSEYSSGPLSYSGRTIRLLQRTTAEQFGWIRRINVEFIMSPWSDSLRLEIDICNKRTPVKVSCSSSMYPLAFTPECEYDLTSELGEVIRAIAARQKASKLRKDDLDHLREKTWSIIDRHRWQE